jgi:uncharacterized protein YbaP (TraB family)
MRQTWKGWRLWATLLLIIAWGAASAGERGLLWRVELPGVSPSYVFGTIHTDDARVTDFPSELKTAMQAANEFMMEILPPSDLTPIFIAQGTIQDKLTENELERFRQLADEHAIPEEMALRIKPWLTAAMFSLPRPQSPMTQDNLLYGMASGQGKKVLGLEESQTHFATLDSIPLDEQMALLRLSLHETTQEKERDFESLVSAYLQRDVDVIAQVDEKQLGQLPPRLWQQIKELLLDRRNEKMSERMLAEMHDRSVFVAVGAAHLAGEGGVLARLRKAGCRVTPLY